MKKWLVNFWYYHKVLVIIILSILAVGIYFLMQGGGVPTDYDIAVVSVRGCSDEQLAKIRSVLEQAGLDQNGDGAVSVKIHVYRFAFGEDGQDAKEIAGLDADLIGKQSGLFFTESPEKFEEATNGTGKAADAVPVSEIPMLSDCGLDGLYLMIRADANEKNTGLRSALTE